MQVIHLEKFAVYSLKLSMQVSNQVTPDHLLLDSAPNLVPLISRREIDKFENCRYRSVRILEVLKLWFQQFLNLSSSQRDMSGPRLGALSNNRWLGGSKWTMDGLAPENTMCYGFLFKSKTRFHEGFRLKWTRSLPTFLNEFANIRIQNVSYRKGKRMKRTAELVLFIIRTECTWRSYESSKNGKRPWGGKLGAYAVLLKLDW